MKLAYLSYWGIENGLSRATVLPNVEILSSFKSVEKIFLFSIERSICEKQQFVNPKIQHIPLYSRFRFLRILNKFLDFLLFPSIINRFMRENKIDVLICRGAPAGAIGLMASDKNTYFVIESFEPHAYYMLESGVWGRYSLSFLLERRWEQKMKRKARALLPVSINYQRKLQSEQVNGDIYLAPCCVNISEFKFNNQQRELSRKSLNIGENKTLGIYVGKFGDIYLKEEFFEVLKELKTQLAEKFHFIILSPQDKSQIQEMLAKYAIDKNSVEILNVKHEDVSKYLSASDYGLVTVRPSPHRKYCSPIKTGEYWANGLPVLITENIGDDSEIISKNNIGTILNLNSISESVNIFINLLFSKGRKEWAEEIMPIALKHRNFELVRSAYEKLLKKY